MTDELDEKQDSEQAEPAAEPKPRECAGEPSQFAAGRADPAPERPKGGRRSTWSIVVRAQGDGPQARAALAELLRRYEPTILRIARRFESGAASASAEDLKQEFITRMLERGDVHRLDRSQGFSFSAWLRVAVTNSLINEKKWALAAKRDESKTDRFEFQPLHRETADRSFERQFAEDTLRCAYERLRAMTKEKPIFDLWVRLLPGAQLDLEDVGELATAVGKTRGAVSAEICRLRKRFKRVLREVVADSLDVDPADAKDATAIDRELSSLYRALREVPPLEVMREDA